MQNQSKVDLLVKDIKWRINSGIFKPNQKIPSENSYAISFGISRSTARKALQRLIEEKYIVSRKSVGYFVSLSKDKLSVNPTKGKLGKKKVQKIDISSLTKNEIDLIKSSGLEEEFIRKGFNHIFVKSYMKEDGTPFHTKIIFINSENKKLFYLESVLKGVSAIYYKNDIDIKRRDEYMVLTEPSQFIRVKLDYWDKAHIPVVVGIMRDKNNKIIEVALEYTTPKDFIYKRKINY